MLKINNVSKTFNANTINKKTALCGVSLHLSEGDFVTVIGSNGAGKSTLLNAVAGTFFVDEGSIIIDGEDVTKTKEYKRAKLIARVFQDPMKGTASDMQIEENLAIADRRGKRRGLSWNVSSQDHKRFYQLLQTLDMGLEDRMTQKVSLLSGGQRQALTLLMATLNKPKVLLLDEHTAALDPKTAEKVLELTRKLQQQNNQTTIMITHNMKDALENGNRLVMMDQGKIIFEASGEEKQKLTVADLLQKFAELGNMTDKIALANN